jgi:iron complex outermembrane recepter protein
MRICSRSTALLACAPIALAVGPHATAQTVRFDIPPGSMNAALTEFGIQSGRAIAFSDDAVQGLSTRGVTGQLDRETALRSLIGGTPLAFRRIPDGFAVVRSAAAATAAPARKTVSAISPAAPPTSAEPPAPTEILVTAQGRSQSLQDVPISASVTSGVTIQKNAINTLGDLSSHVPGVEIAQAPVTALLNIRGVGSGINTGFEQSVGTFVDGVYRGRSRAIGAALFDVDSVEVLKGPQTTFFGNNTIAGAFNITTRKPQNQFSYNGSALYGSFGQYALEAGITAPLTQTLSIRVAAKAYGEDGYVKNAMTGQDGPHDRDAIGRISAVWQPTPDFTSRLRVDRGRLRDKDQFVSELLNCPPPSGAASGLCARYLAQNGGTVDDTLNDRRDGYPGVYDYDFVEAAWTNELVLGAYKVQATTGYFQHKLYDGSQPWPIPVTGVDGVNSIFAITQYERYQDISQEVRIISPEDRPISFLAGAYYSHGVLNSSEYYGYYFLPFGSYIAPLYNATDLITENQTLYQRDTVGSLFAAATAHASDRLRINVGLRYSIVHKFAQRGDVVGTTSNGGYVTPGDFTPGTAAQQASMLAVLGSSSAQFADPTRTDRKFMPSVSAQYDLAPKVTIYASFTQGFKAGGFSDGTTPNPFGPENVNAYEVGLKGRFLDQRLTLNMAAFWSDFKDLQETSNVVLADGTVAMYVANAARAVSRGIELESSFRADSRFQLRASLSYLDTRYLDFPNGPCTAYQTAANPDDCTQDLSGKPRPFAPKWSGNAGASYTLPLGQRALSIEPTVRFSSRYSQAVNNDPELFQSGYAKLDTRIAYGPDNRRWELALVGTNLTNTMTASFRNTVGTSVGTTYGIPDPGRSVLVQLSIRG